MNTYQYNIEELSALGVTAATLSYRADAADELSLSIIPSAYGASFPWQALDRVEIFATVGGERCRVFSGVVPVRAGVSLSGGAAPSMQLRACSDYYLLTQTVYAKLDSTTGTPMAERDAELVNVGAFARKIYNWAKGWSGTPLTAELSVVAESLGTAPAPVSSGTTSCAAMLEQALQWQPDVLFRHRYGAATPLLELCHPAAEPPLTLSVQHDAISDLSVQARPDLVPPVCALVGAVHATWPAGADVRTPGAFVYAVPQAANSDPAASSAGSGGNTKAQKMELRGFRLPAELTLLQQDSEISWQCSEPSANLLRFILRFFPQLAPLKQHLLVSTGTVLPTAADAAFEPSADPDAQPTPANYDTALDSWSATGVFIHTSGSFPASATPAKNVSGLKWCKAQILLGVAISADSYDKLTITQKAEADRLLPGTRAVSSEGDSLRRWATLRLSCNLINRSRKCFSTADNKLLASDPDFSADSANAEQSTRAAMYREAMQEYYNATRTIYSEGSLSLRLNAEINPAELIGRPLHILGLASEWESMHAITRAASWNLNTSEISLEFGSREILGFSERLERRTMARNASRNPQRSATLGADSLDSTAAADEEQAMTIAPDTATELTAGTMGQDRKPFSLYCENGTYYYTGGIFTALGQVIEVPHTQFTIQHGQKTSTPLTDSPAHLTLIRANGTITFNLTQTT